MADRNEHLVVVMVEPAPTGEFIEWPLHITIVPWFSVLDEKSLDKILARIAASHKPFKVEVGGIEQFGRKDKLDVNVIVPNENLNSLHRGMLHSLEEGGFHVHQKDFVENNYRAHITHQGQNHKNVGDNVQISSFVLIKQIRQRKTGTMIKSVAKEYSLQYE